MSRQNELEGAVRQQVGRCQQLSNDLRQHAKGLSLAERHFLNHVANALDEISEELRAAVQRRDRRATSFYLKWIGWTVAPVAAAATSGFFQGVAQELVDRSQHLTETCLVVEEAFEAEERLDRLRSSLMPLEAVHGFSARIVWGIEPGDRHVLTLTASPAPAEPPGYVPEVLDVILATGFERGTIDYVRSDTVHTVNIPIELNGPQSSTD